MTFRNLNSIKWYYLFLLLLLSFKLTGEADNNIKIQIDSLLKSAENLKRSNADQAIAIATKVQNLADANGMVESRIKANILLAWIHSLRKDYPKARTILDKTLIETRRINHQELELEAWVDWAFLFERTGDFDKAADELLKANKLAQQLGNQAQMAEIHSNMAKVYFNYKDMAKAIESMDKAKDIYEDLEAYDMLSPLYNNLAILYRNSGNNKAAITSFQRAAETSLILKDSLGAAVTYNNLGFLYLLDNQLEESEKYLLESLNIFDIYNQENPVNHHYLGKLYYQQQHTVLSERHSLKALSLFEQNEMKYEMISSRELLAQTNALAGNFEKAYRYQVEVDEGKESLFKLDKSKAVELIENKYELQQKELDLLTLNQQNERRKFMILGLLGLGAFLTVFGLQFFKNRQLKYQQEQLSLEQRFLRAQMNPHFIFNALANIQGFILKNNNKDASRFLAKFSKLVRTILENSRKEYVPLSEELIAMQNYLDLQQLRFPEKMEYVIEIDEQINPEEIAIAPMLTQSFIENAIEHGIQHKKGKGKLVIKFEQKKDALIFSLSDNGIGRAKALRHTKKNTEHESLSTIITQERLKVYQQNRQRNYQLEIKDKKEAGQQAAGTSVKIELPFIFN